MPWAKHVSTARRLGHKEMDLHGCRTLISAGRWCRRASCRIKQETRIRLSYFYSFLAVWCSRGFIGHICIDLFPSRYCFYVEEHQRVPRRCICWTMVMVQQTWKWKSQQFFSICEMAAKVRDLMDWKLKCGQSSVVHNCLSLSTYKMLFAHLLAPTFRGTAIFGNWGGYADGTRFGPRVLGPVT